MLGVLTSLFVSVLLYKLFGWYSFPIIMLMAYLVQQQSKKLSELANQVDKDLSKWKKAKTSAIFV